MQEHFYTDDPAIGPPDVRTRLADVDYFFLGNGHVQAAVQVCRSGEGTPLGLSIMHPERFGPKRAALTCQDDVGLANTMIAVRIGDVVFTPQPNNIRSQWHHHELVPAVRVSWFAGSLQVSEVFFCPDRDSPHICRLIEVTPESSAAASIALLAYRAEPSEQQSLNLAVGRSATALVTYQLAHSGDRYEVESQWESNVRPTRGATQYWNGLTTIQTNDVDLDYLFESARSQLPVAVDAGGRMDGSIWQYNLEWVRDQAHVAEALARLGDHELAGVMLGRLLDHFVSADGDTVDSGRRRAPAEIELDQNGELLAALGTYVDWTGDLKLVESRWSKVQQLADFPFDEQFRHEPSGLLHNRREYWERHEGHGIQDGVELTHQFFVAQGLADAAHLADLVGADADRDRWLQASDQLRHAMLEEPRYRLIEDGHFIKRRGVDGTWQETITAPPHCLLPKGIPLKEKGAHYLDPDTSSVLPVAYRFVDPHGELARDTLAHMEKLWNQRWDGGGYGRYNASSEADSAGPWPFASLFVARAYTEAGNDAKVWRVLRWLASKPGGIAGSWFEFDGPRIAPPYPQVGFTPWTWAELITLYVHHLLGVRPDDKGITIRPHLLKGLDRMDAALRVQGHRLQLAVRRAQTATERGGLTAETELLWQEEGVRLPVLQSDVDVTVLC